MTRRRSTAPATGDSIARPLANPRAPGVTPAGGQRAFCRVWAPRASSAAIRLIAPQERLVPLSPAACGYYETTADGVTAGARYFVRLDGDTDRPDPASRSQPDGVHGPSEVVDPAFEWQDSHWRNPPLDDYVLYELHVGTYTAQGTFDAIVPHLAGLQDMGVTAIEIMPVAQFPGTRNWGYDGAYPYAVQNSYGGPDGLRRLVNACHAAGLAFVLDVVYNHLGPEGSYLAEFGPYFTDRYRTPWGAAVNFDGPDSDPVREFFVENALYWIREFHVDALRLDAVHAIYDFSARPFLEELAEAVDREGEEHARRAYLIAESALNDPRVVRTREAGGYAVHAQWNDDFHHGLHVALTGERTGYYVDYEGVADLATSLNEAFVYTGQYSKYRRRRFGAPARDLPPERFVAFSQNHDQVGNRMLGERLGQPLPFEASKLAAAVLLLSPFIPLLWMGEEYGEHAPFLYFVSHSDSRLVEAVRQGRQEEFEEFAWQGEPPDPQSEDTFERSRLDHTLKGSEPGRTLLRFYRMLLDLRRRRPVFGREGRPSRPGARRLMTAASLVEPPGLLLRTRTARRGGVVFHHFGATAADVRVPAARGRWRRVLDSADTEWRGPGTLIGADLAPGGELRLQVQPFSTVVLEEAG
ncbi:MAG: malto-oligosyltrehalose trehalohydrolase [Chloroflexi bacterium]|nr:malto-oligosyltrehalose trehalohydrolase [Chloroflexota bacterium]